MSAQHRNLAATAAQWSATHRRRTIVGWLVLVTLVFMAGGVAGQRQLERIDSGNGESQRADRVVQGAFAAKADENVLVQGLGGVRAHDPAFTAALRDVQGRLAATSQVFDVRAPIGRANPGQLSHDGRSALVSFSIHGGERTWERRV